MVETSEGVIPIYKVHSGDYVLARDEEGNDRWVTVARTYKALRVGYFVLNGELNVTNDHPFYVDGRWVEAEDLKVGDNLTDREGNPIEISSITWVDKGIRVHNIDVLSPDTFFAGGYLVHNKGPKIGM